MVVGDTDADSNITHTHQLRSKKKGQMNMNVYFYFYFCKENYMLWPLTVIFCFIKAKERRLIVRFCVCFMLSITGKVRINIITF